MLESDAFLKTLPDQDWITCADRLKTFGEVPAMRWILSKYGQRRPLSVRRGSRRLRLPHTPGLPHRLHLSPACLNLSYMRATLTISLPPPLRRDVSRAAKAQRVSESEFVRRAVQKQLWADAFEQTRRQLAPRARTQGLYTDEDVFKVVS